MRLFNTFSKFRIYSDRIVRKYECVRTKIDVIDRKIFSRKKKALPNKQNRKISLS
jgi:hypothetical protein